MSELDQKIPSPSLRFHGSTQKRVGNLLAQAARWAIPISGLVRLASVALYSRRLQDDSGKAFSADELVSETDSPVRRAIATEFPRSADTIDVSKSITDADHGKTFVPVDETNNLVVLPSNPKAIRFTIYVEASGDTPVEFECAQDFYFLSGDVTGGDSDGTAGLPPGTYPFVVEAIGGKWFITSAI